MRAAPSLVVAGVLATSTALAASLNAPKVHDLAEASMPTPPTLDAKPASIDAASRIDGLTIAATPGAPAQHVALSRFARKNAASMPAAPPSQAMLSVPSDACLAVLANGRDAFRAAQLFLDAYEGVLPVRLEKLEEQGDKATLDVVDAWVDPATLGAKEIARVSIPLAKLAVGPLGAAVYGFRTGSTITIVAPAGQNAQLTDASGRAVTASCGVTRAELVAEKGKGATLTGFFTKMSPAESKNGLEVTPPMPIRFALSASVSQMSADPEPLLSVTIRPIDPLPQKQSLAAVAPTE